MCHNQHDEITRYSKAERYLNQELKGQRQWYSEKATTYKRRSQALGFAVIAAGVTTSFIQIFSANYWAPIATAGLGAIIVLIEGWQRISQYGEIWPAYRTASERMKRETRLYQNGAAQYRNLNEDDAYLRFIEEIENIIFDEQRIYWQSVSNKKLSTLERGEKNKL